MARRRQLHYQPPRCAHCNKEARDGNFLVASVPESTDPSLVHLVFDPMVIPAVVYHNCGHYTVYRREPMDSGQQR